MPCPRPGRTRVGSPRPIPTWGGGDPAHVCSGPRYDDGAERRGWLIGHFIEPETSPLHSTDVEIKWGTHTAGEERHEWTIAEDEVRTTMVMLLRGHFAVRLPDGDQEMKREGDFVVFGPGTSHSWQAFDDSIVMTVRWPSIV